MTHADDEAQETARTMFDHIGKWTLIRAGAQNRMHGNDFVQFDMTMERRERRCMVQLNDRDLYRVWVGRFHRRTLEYTTMYEADDIQAANLSQTIENAFVDVMSH